MIGTEYLKVGDRFYAGPNGARQYSSGEPYSDMGLTGYTYPKGQLLGEFTGQTRMGSWTKIQLRPIGGGSEFRVVTPDVIDQRAHEQQTPVNPGDKAYATQSTSDNWYGMPRKFSPGSYMGTWTGKAERYPLGNDGDSTSIEIRQDNGVLVSVDIQEVAGWVNLGGVTVVDNTPKMGIGLPLVENLNPISPQTKPSPATSVGFKIPLLWWVLGGVVLLAVLLGVFSPSSDD